MTPAHISTSTLKRAALVAGLWTVFGLLWSAPNVFDAPSGREGAELLDSVNHVVPFYWAWAILTPAVLWIARRAGRHPLGDWRLWAIVAAGLPVAIIVQGLIYLVVLGVLGIEPLAIDIARMTKHVVRHGGGDAATYLTLIGVVLLLQANARARERELAAGALASRLARADLELLRWQLHPHFLFNALNTVSTLVLRGESDRADRAIQLIARYLRAALGQRADAMITLREELDAVSRYMEIEALRFGDATSLEMKVPAQLGMARLPGAILQPLVENAIRHGGGPVTLEASNDAGRLRIAVTDPGVSTAPAASPATDGAGFGLAYVTERLRQFYGSNASFALSTGAGPSVAALDLPLTIEP